MDVDEKVGRAFVIGTLIWFVAATQPTPVTRTVDDDDPTADFSSIQPAINVSSSGDVILVRCGLYVENLSIKDGVSVIGERPDCTILDGNASGSVVTFINVRSLTELSGFTIQNGRSSMGGGIFLDSSSPIITRNVIVGNQSLKTPEGIFGYGGGIEVYDSYPTITNNLITGNSAERTGGGVDMIWSFPTLRNNTIVGNSAFLPGSGEAFGGGVYSVWSDPTLESNIIADNTAEAGGGGLEFVNTDFFTIEYNDIFGNLPVNTSGVPIPPGPGNISADPLLLQWPELFEGCPRSDSPVIDAGQPAATLDLADFFDRQRVVDGDFDGTARVDIGFCEGGDITRVAIGSGAALTWDPSVSSSAGYNVYRGSLVEFKASCATDCIYTQDPSVVTGAHRECGIPSADGSIIPNDNPCP
jgi:hypothetical protein